MISYPRYLESKRSIDDESLNSHVFSNLQSLFPKDHKLKVIELGSGIGTMIARAMDWGLFTHGEYLAIDRDLSLLAYSVEYLKEWSSSRKLNLEAHETSVHIWGRDMDVMVTLLANDVLSYKEAGHQGEFDLLIAHLFLDLIDVREHLLGFLRMLRSGGVFYLTHLFDGLTVIFSQEDSELDRRILEIYHSTMNRKGEEEYNRSETGRNVLSLLMETGWVEVVDAGSSDWVVVPSRKGYSQDQSDFLNFILDTIYRALNDDDFGMAGGLDEWIEGKKEQLMKKELGLIVHQLDVVGRVV